MYVSLQSAQYIYTNLSFMLVESSGIVDTALFCCSLKAKPPFIEHSEVIYIYIYIYI